MDAAGTIHVVIVNFRTPDLTIKTLDALYASELPADARLCVTVVDNNSGDGSVERIAAHAPHARIIRSPANLGFAGGNNLALREILAETASVADPHDAWVLLLNSDLVVERDTLARCLAFLRAHPRAGVAGPKIMLPDGRLDLACRRGFPTPARAFWKLVGVAKRFPNDPRFAGYNLTHLPVDETVEIDSGTGAFMLVRLAAVRDAGLLDDDFFMYGEDLDWAWRIKQHGWSVWYVHDATALHLKGATSRRQSTRMIVEFYRAMWIFYRKHQSPRRGVLLDCAVMSGIVARAALALGANALRPPAARRVS